MEVSFHPSTVRLQSAQYVKIKLRTYAYMHAYISHICIIIIKMWMHMKSEKTRHTFCCIGCILLSKSYLCKEVSFLTISISTELSEHFLKMTGTCLK